MPSSEKSSRSRYKTIGNRKNLLCKIGFEGEWSDFVLYCKEANKNRNNRYYNCVLEPKPNNPNEMRKIDKPKYKLKQYQRRLYSFLSTRVEFAECVHGSIKGKSYITNACRHLHSRFFFLADIEKFYPSVTMSMVFTALKTVATPEIAEALTDLVTLENGLATGSPASPILANMVLKELDVGIMRLCEEKNVIYSRYVDDITISASWDFRQTDVSDRVLKMLHSFGFRHKRGKTHFSKGKTEVTGVVVARCRVRPTESALKKLRESRLSEKDESKYKGLRQHIRNINKSNEEYFSLNKLV